MGGKRWVESLIEQGTGGLPDSTRKRVRLTNIGALFGAMAMLVTTPFDVAQVSSWMTAVDVVAVLVFMAILVANRYGHVTASRVGFVVVANLLALTNATGLGRESGVELLFLALTAIPFVVFDLRERGALVLGLVMPLAGLGLSELDLLYRIGGVTPGYSARAYHVYSIVVAVSISLFALYQISRENARVEHALRLDIAARQQAERELAESRQASINAAKMAALGEMSASVAHEVNNPLMAIMLRVQRFEWLARKDSLDVAAVLKTAREIDRTVNRIGSIVDALRAFARQGEEDPLRPEPVEPIVMDTVELCAHRFRLRQIELAVDPIPEGLQAHCRGAQVSQVLINLLSNAYDAVENRARRRVRITVEARNAEVQIAVVDSGPGIRPEISGRIMEPFFTTKEIGRGTGLGLSLSKGIAETHGGRLELDPHSPETRFVLTLKRAAPTSSADVVRTG